MKTFKDTPNKVHRILLSVPMKHGINHLDLPNQAAGRDDGSIWKENGLDQLLKTLRNAMVPMTVYEGSTVKEKSHN